MKTGVAEVGLVGQIVNCYANVETILTIGICWLFEGGETVNHNQFSGQANYTESCTLITEAITATPSGACAGSPQTLGVSPPSRLNTVTNIFTTSPHKPSALHHQPQSTAWSFNQQFKTIIVNPVSTQCLMSVYLVDRETVAVEAPPITSQQSSSSQTNCHCLEPSSQTLSISISIWWRPSPESLDQTQSPRHLPTSGVWTHGVTRAPPRVVRSSVNISQQYSTVQRSTAQYSCSTVISHHLSPGDWQIEIVSATQPAASSQWAGTSGLSSHKHNTNNNDGTLYITLSIYIYPQKTLNKLLIEN